MDWHGWLTILLTCAVILALVFIPRVSPDVVLMGALTALSVTGVLTPKEALSGFSNSGLMTIAALFVVAAGIRASGGVDLIVHHILCNPTSHRGAIVRLVVPVIALSGFLNNTPIVATMVPAVTRWCKRISIAPSKLMIPLSYAAILGGSLTLIGTSTNLVVNGLYRDLTGTEGFSLFDITLVGLPSALIGALFLIFGISRFLPDRLRTTEKFANPKQFTFEVAVAANGPLVGKTVAKAGLRHLQRIYLVEIERRDAIVTAVSPEERLQAGDRLVFVGETSAIVDILRINGLVASDNTEPVIEKARPERRLIEAVVSPFCDCIGQTIRDSRFRDRYDAVVLAAARGGEPIEGNLGSITLQPGDLLLLETRPEFVGRQRAERDFLLTNDLHEELPDPTRAKLSWAILILIVVLATFGITSMLNAALIGAALMLSTRCCSVSDARRSLDLTVIVTIAASFAVGLAFEKTRAAESIASTVLAAADSDPWMLLLFTYVTVSAMTAIITNNAAAVLMLPIVLALTDTLGVNAEPFVIATMMAASASFATPLGYQTNLMVYGAGSYYFTDFLKAGIPMNLAVGGATILIIPLLWPLSG